MTTALAVRQPTTGDWAMIQSVAQSAKDSMKLGLAKQQEAEMKLLTAWENGFPLTAAFGIVHIINNIPALSPKAIWAKIVGHPEFGGYKEERLEERGSFIGYRITLKRKTGMEASRQFTLANAETAKLNKKDNWVMYQENMCYWRAMGHVQDVVFPDVTLGLARADMLGAYISDDGDVIEGSWSVGSQQGANALPTATFANVPVTQTATVSQPKPLTIQDLLATYTPQQIMAANNGTIPGTPEECQKVLDFISQATGTPLGDDVSFGGVLNE